MKHDLLTNQAAELLKIKVEGDFAEGILIAKNHFSDNAILHFIADSFEFDGSWFISADLYSKNSSEIGWKIFCQSANKKKSDEKLAKLINHVEKSNGAELNIHVMKAFISSIGGYLQGK